MPSRLFPPSSHSMFPVLSHELPRSRGHPIWLSHALLLPTALSAAPRGGPYLGGSLYSQWREGLRCLRLAWGLAEGGNSGGRAHRDPRE